MKIKSIKKKIKRIVKKKYIYDGKVLFTVSEICKMIKIDVPKKFNKIKNLPLIETKLLNKLENSKDIYNNFRIKRLFFYKPKEVRKYLRKFREKYDTQDCLAKSNVKLIEMLIDWYYLSDNYGFNYNDYFDYEIYNKKMIDYDKFLNSEYRSIVYKICNDKNYTFYFRNKGEFNKKFSKYVNRDWIDGTSCTRDEFLKFVKKHPRFFSKPITGTGGYGAGILKYDGENLDKLLDIVRKNELICEEIVKQHKDMAAFCEDTLNTCRLYTLKKKDGDVIVTLANARFGRMGNEVDNFHSGGVSAGIDLETGKLCTDSINRAHLKFKKHPDSGITFKGYQIPLWDKAVEAVCEMAKDVPNIRHIGWDVAFTEDGNIELIEGNGWPNFDITQAVDQVGKKYRYHEHLLELDEKGVIKEAKI